MMPLDTVSNKLAELRSILPFVGMFPMDADVARPPPIPEKILSAKIPRKIIATHQCQKAKIKTHNSTFSERLGNTYCITMKNIRASPICNIDGMRPF